MNATLVRRDKVEKPTNPVITTAPSEQTNPMSKGTEQRKTVGTNDAAKEMNARAACGLEPRKTQCTL